ncbi:MAG TPA: hypothetical protein VE673_00755 [Pseudonocardiaceae bacterium]|jgi:hypothetical protein|nr:hypothetical protein [Pseudonocardiaceae bacterium]
MAALVLEAHRLECDRYTQVAGGEPGQPLVLIDPIAVTLDLGALAAASLPR